MQGIIRVPGNWIPDSLKGIIWFPGSPGIGSSSTVMYYFCAFPLRFEKYVGSVSVLGSTIFAPTGVKSKGDDFVSGILVPTGVKSKGGKLIEIFWRLNSLFSLQICKSVL